MKKSNWSHHDIVDLIEAQPLALIVSSDPSFTVTPLPMLVEVDAAKRPATLLGHFAKSNPQVDAIRAAPRTCFLFLGPHAYVSPELITSTRDWAPTWNYAFVRIVADVRFDEELNDEAIQKLIAKMERGRSRPWSTGEMGPRYERLKAHVIGFRATIVDMDARFKLAQDERTDILSDILAGFNGTALADWMRRFNAERAAP